MAKDTSNTGKDSSGREFDLTKNADVKKGLEKNAQRADEVIVAQSKDSSNDSIQAGNNARMKGLPSAGSVPKNPNVPDVLRAKPTVEPLSLGRETGRSKRNVGTGRKEKTGVLDFGSLPSRPEGASSPAAVNATNRPEVASNVIGRMKSGMGLPGSENGDLDLALKLHSRDLQTAKTTGKVVNDVSPDDTPKTTHVQVYGGHHARYARVMRVMGIGDEEVYKNAASASGMRLPAYVAGLHGKVVQHETSKKDMTHTLTGDEHWEHPTTKEIIPVAAKHPDMPSSFTRSEGVISKVVRGTDGKPVLDSGYRGWDKTTSRGGKGGKTVLRYSAGPTKGVDVIDQLRVDMLSDHGSSSTSRKKGASIANDIADVASGAVPRGMKQIGKRKVAVSEPAGIVGETQADNSRKYKTTFKTKEGTAPLLVPIAKRGRPAGDPPAPPKAKTNSMLVGQGDPKLTSEIPFFKDAPAKKNNIIDEAAYKNPKRVNPNRGQQFAAIDTDGMTGAEEVRALRSKGALASQKNLSESKDVELRPGGKEQASKDRGKTVQMSLFPSIKTPKESRKTSFYMAGSVQPISEASKRLQGDSKKRFGRKEDAIAVEGGYSGANDAKLEQPEGSRADKKNTKKLATES